MFRSRYSNLFATAICPCSVKLKIKLACGLPNLVASAFPTKEKCQSPQTTWLSFPREHVRSAVGVQDLEFWLLPSVWEKSLESQEAAQKRITWGFFWPELKVWSERTSQSQLAPLYCCAESPKALGSQVNEPALAFWWWLPPLQWEAEKLAQGS